MPHTERAEADFRRNAGGRWPGEAGAASAATMWQRDYAYGGLCGFRPYSPRAVQQDVHGVRVELRVAARIKYKVPL